MRYDVEIGVAQMVADYLGSILDPEIFNACPAVTFYDPMSIDQADRVVVMAPTVDTDPSSPGNFSVQVEVGLKTRFAQPTLKADMDRHFARANKLRDKLMAGDMLSRLLEYCPDGLGLEFVQPRRQFSTSVREDGWIYSEAAFRVQCFAEST